jgi:proteic killer suppression protein
MIQGFADKETESIWLGIRSRKLPPDIQPRARECLRRIAAAGRLTDLRIPPGNRLHALTGNRAEQHAVRINQQWRITFTWTESGPDHVKIEDYH